MKFEEMPKIYGADTREVEICKPEDLKNAGAVFTSYGISAGETVEIPSTRDAVVVVKQPSQNIRSDGTRSMQYFISVMRGDKKGWLSMGSVVRRDAHQEPIDVVAREMLEFDNIEDRINAMLGRKITCKGRENRSMREFKNRVSTGEIIEQPVNIYVWA